MSYTPPNPNGQANSANSAPAVLSSEQEAILQAIKDGVDGLEALITTLNGNTDGLETLLATLNGYVDGLEGKDYATQTTLALIAGYVDTIESLIMLFQQLWQMEIGLTHLQICLAGS
jgi:hypothetical protein